MAQEWCVNYGVLSHEDASKLYRIIMKRKGKPITSSGSSSRNSPSPKRRKKVKSEPVEAVDVGLSAGGDERIGFTAM
jgi:hypothetical protein